MLISKKIAYSFLMTLLLAASLTSAQIPLGNAFTYQGQLGDGGVPASGDYNFVFRLFDDPTGGDQVGDEVLIDGWPVTDGLFTVQLDFGEDAFTGNALWLEVSVQASDGGSDFTTLSPRQPLTAAPYALYALNAPGGSGFWAANGNDIYNTNSGQVGIGTTSPSYSLHVESTDDNAIHGKNTASGGIALYGLASSFDGGGFGIRGESYGPTGGGVMGIAAMTTGINYGVYGQSQSQDGYGVYGLANNANGTNVGVRGESNSASGWAGYFVGRSYFSYRVGIGIESPTEALDVVGTIKTTGFQLTTSPGDGYVLTSDDDGRGSWQPLGAVFAGAKEPDATAHARGTAHLVNGRATVTLPDHFIAVATVQGMTVQITPHSAESKGLAVVERSVEGFAVHELFSGTGNYDFDYTVMAIRK